MLCSLRSHYSRFPLRLPKCLETLQKHYLPKSFLEILFSLQAEQMWNSEKSHWKQSGIHKGWVLQIQKFALTVMEEGKCQENMFFGICRQFTVQGSWSEKFCIICSGPEFSGVFSHLLHLEMEIYGLEYFLLRSTYTHLGCNILIRQQDINLLLLSDGKQSHGEILGKTFLSAACFKNCVDFYF